MTENPLVRHFPPGAPIGWRNGQPVSLERFLSAACALAQRLPQGKYCINLCEDRLNFMLGFAAALIARATSLLPHNRTSSVLDGLTAAYAGACFLADSPQISTYSNRIDIQSWPEADGPATLPFIPSAHEAVIVFTSGSTGSPNPHVKTWGSLTHAAQIARDSLSIAPGSAFLGAVPAQHMWGLEMTVMLPLQAGCAVDAGCPLLPADIAAALARIPSPRWLVATPAHLRACALSGIQLPKMSGVLCSTAVLATNIAQSMEQSGAAPLLEIYGSTETGALAMRRPTQSAAFRTLGGINLDVSSGTTVARGGHLPHPIVLNDILDLRNEVEFTLRGRASDLIKIAGKRGSLAALNLELNSIPGIVDGVFFVPENWRGEPRLMAFVVAPDMNATAILDRLRRRLDPVFLPRPLVMVDALPRNPAGKLSREILHKLAVETGCSSERPAGCDTPLQQVAASHPALPHHFPGNPIVPGVWLLALVERAARDRYGAGLRICAIPDVRFRTALRPEEPFRITLQQVAADRLAFAVERESVRIADGTLVVQVIP